MTMRAAYLLVVAISTAAVLSALFVIGLRRRRVMTLSNLRVERDRSPAIYWTFQAYYAASVVVCACGGALLASGYKFGRGAALDKPLLALFGSFFLFAAVVLGTIVGIGLRTGVAVRSSWVSHRAPPSRKENPVRYWALQFFYVFMTILTTVFGGAMLIVVAK
jgi:hypothetical protein